MDRQDALDELQRHVAASLAVLSRGVTQLEGDRDAFLAAQPALRAEMGEALGAYQAFKHGKVFDPGIASGDAARVVAAREMKIACIKAGETFRGHMSDWPRERIEREWSNYRVASRLTANSLSRHIRDESDGVAALIRRFGA
jgi:hypothetical protein